MTDPLDPPCDTIAGRRVLFVMATDHEYGPHLRRLIRPVVTGVGPIEAALGTGVALARLADRDAGAALVVSLGSAGSRRCPVGTVHQVRSLAWRDIDASPLGFARGVTPFLDHPPVVPLATPIAGLSAASLSTGADVVVGDAYAAIDADLVDMESFAVWRACARFGVPMIGLRGVSDGPGTLASIGGWTELLPLLDARLADAVERLADVPPDRWPSPTRSP